MTRELNSSINSLVWSVIFFAVLSGCKHTNEPEDPCALYEQALNGSFTTPAYNSTMIFAGGLEGTVEIAGLDVTDMTCTYQIMDCMTGKVSMLCEQSIDHETIIQVFSPDSIKVGDFPYVRKAQ